MAGKNELKVRFNEESKDIEVVINDAVIGNVEPELYKEWLASEFPQEVDTSTIETERDHWKAQYETLQAALNVPGATGPTGSDSTAVESGGETGTTGATGSESSE